MSDKVQGGAGPQTTGTTIMANTNCVIFNHVNYIRTALGSFPMQKTGSTSGILVHDDASTDGTNDIVREYAARHPKKMKPLIQTGNQYSQGIDNISGAFNLPRTRGKYIFMCDDDDYFLSPDKLRKQVDYMETHPDCTLCTHSANIDLMGKALAEDQMRSYRKNRVLSPEKITDKPSGYAISSMIFPARLVGDLSDYYVDYPVGDTPIQLVAAASGYDYCFDEAMNAYRIGVVGSWTVEGKNGDYQGKQRVCYDHTRRTCEQFGRATGGRFREAAENAARRTCYQTMVNTKQFEEIFNPQYYRYYRELTPRIRFFLGFEHTMPAVYKMVKEASIGK